MTDLKTTHKGYGISYSENEDTWRCWDLDMEAYRLGTLRAKIDKHLLEYRRVSVPAIHIGHEIEDVHITLIAEEDEPVSPRHWRSRRADHVFVTRRKGGKGPLERRKLRVDELAPETPEAREAIAKFQKARAVMAAASRAYNEAKEAIPRMTMADVKAELLPEPTEAPPEA